MSQCRRSVIKRLEDILAAFEVHDNTGSLPEMSCEAKDMLKLPPLSLDPVSELVNQNSVSLGEVLTNLSSLKEQVNSSVLSLISKISTVQSRVTELSTASLKIAPKSHPSVSPLLLDARPRYQHSSSSFDLQRRGNLILFGLPEQGSLVETKSAVDEVLESLVGRQFPVKDLVRLGKLKTQSGGPQTPQHPWPVLVKFSSAWDRRLVLISKRKLKEYSIGRLFIREDLFPQVRLERKKPPISTDIAILSSTSSTPSADLPPLSDTHSIVLCPGSNNACH